ncbi:MAG: CBS domain-containing protein [Polyangiaceae bacterium]
MTKMKGHARGLMTPHATTVPRDMALADVARVLLTAGFDGVPVVEDDVLVGFLSELDIAQALLDGRLGSRAGEVMSQRVVHVDEFATTDEVIRTLREHRIHHLPVVRNGVVVGIITPADVIRHFMGEGGDAA